MGDVLAFRRPPPPPPEAPLLSVRLVDCSDGRELCILKMAFEGEQLQHSISKAELEEVIASFIMVHQAMKD